MSTLTNTNEKRMQLQSLENKKEKNQLEELDYTKTFAQDYMWL